jgi:hypothetical protein
MPIDDVLVSYSSLIEAIHGNESAVQEAAAKQADKLGDPWQQAALLGRFGQALRELEKSQADADRDVMHSPQDEMASLMQSVAAARGRDFQPVTAGGKELKFYKDDVFGWALSLLDWSVQKHGIVRPPNDQTIPLPDNARIALIGDWGTNLYGAPVCAKSIAEDTRPFSAVMHLGDVYYSGTDIEVNQRFLNVWPKRTDARSFALNSNHEMYSGGYSYFGLTLPKFGQESSYFALTNKNWLLIGLDTAHSDFDLDEEQAKWVKRVVGAAGLERKVILFSHHQLFSALDHQGPKLARALGELLTKRRIFAWYWGHEHRCVVYDKHELYGLHGRCIGHSGFPENRKKVKDAPVEKKSGSMVWKRVRKLVDVPPALVLDGPNSFIKGKEKKYAPHGYAVIELDDKLLNETVYTPDRVKIYANQPS